MSMPAVQRSHETVPKYRFQRRKHELRNSAVPARAGGVQLHFADSSIRSDKDEDSQKSGVVV